MIDETAPPSPPPLPPPLKKRRINPATGKLAWIVALALMTMIPNTMINNLIGERQQNEQEAKQAVAKSWGPAQTLTAPTLMLPFKTPTPSGGTPATTYVNIKPSSLDIDAEIIPERRRRGFFEATVYTTTIHLKGSFAVPETIPAADGTPLLPPRSGFIALALSDASGIAGDDKASIGGVQGAWQSMPEPRPNTCKATDDVLVVPTNFSRSRGTMMFETTLHVRGSGQLRVSGLGKAANATIRGAWPSPSFMGDAAPATSNVSPDGFQARWHVDGLDDRSLTTSGCVVDAANTTPAVGVDLMEPMPIYRMVVRAAKYAPLFIVLGFTAYFVFEMASGIAITILQYALMGASLSLFALLLLSLGEIVGYPSAYLYSAMAVTAQASIYTASVARRLKPGFGFATMLSGLFGFLYVLLGLETFALVTGAVALFVTLSIVMIVTQRIRRARPREDRPDHDKPDLDDPDFAAPAAA